MTFTESESRAVAEISPPQRSLSVISRPATSCCVVHQIGAHREIRRHLLVDIERRAEHVVGADRRRDSRRSSNADPAALVMILTAPPMVLRPAMPPLGPL